MREKEEKEAKKIYVNKRLIFNLCHFIHCSISKSVRESQVPLFCFIFWNRVLILMSLVTKNAFICSKKKCNKKRTSLSFRIFILFLFICNAWNFLNQERYLKSNRQISKKKCCIKYCSIITFNRIKKYIFCSYYIFYSPF